MDITINIIFKTIKSNADYNYTRQAVRFFFTDVTKTQTTEPKSFKKGGKNAQILLFFLFLNFWSV